jgi:3-oxoadipate enol-lactonase
MQAGARFRPEKTTGMPIVQLRDARIHYVLEGPAAGPVLAFSNSLGTTYAMWDLEAAELQKKIRILRYDTRGHGQTSVTPGAYSIEQLGKDVLGLLDVLQLERIHFCGLSMGGMIGMWLAAHARERLDKLVLSSTAAKIGTGETWNARIEMVRRDGMKTVGATVVERWFSPSFRTQDPATVAVAQHMLEETDPEGYASCCAAVRDFDYREKLGEIGCPTLVISATCDPVTPPADGRFLAERIRGAQYAELGAAHLSNMEDPVGFSALLRAFLHVL